MALVRGIIATVEALRAAAPGALIIQVEATELPQVAHPSLDDLITASLDRQFLPGDLVTGRVGGAHPLSAWLSENGALDRDLATVRASAARLDILSVNFYPHLSCFVATDRSTRGRRGRYGTADDLAKVLIMYHRHFGIPVMVTETSDNARASRRGRWMDQAVRGVRGSREAGVEVVGLTWFPVFSHVDWRYRRGRLPLSAYWRHMGLWDLRPAADPRLQRYSTPLVDQFAAHVAGGDSAVGLIGGYQPLRPTEAIPPSSRFWAKK